MSLSPHELIFGIKPKNLKMINLSSTTNNFGHCKPSKKSQCHSFPKHTLTDHLGHQPQIKKLQKKLHIGS